MSEATGSSSSTVRLELDAEMKLQWESQRKKIAEAQKEGAASFVALWKSVAEVVDHSPPLYLAAGFSNAKAFFEKYLGVERRTAIRNLEVARRASRAEVERFGVTKLDAALGLLADDDQTSFDKLKVAVERKGKPTKVGLEEASAVEIRLAVQSLHPKRLIPPKPNSTIAVLTRALHDAKLGSVGVVVSRSGITFRGVKAENLKLLAAVLSRVDLTGEQAVATIGRKLKAA